MRTVAEILGLLATLVMIGMLVWRDALRPRPAKVLAVPHPYDLRPTCANLTPAQIIFHNPPPPPGPQEAEWMRWASRLAEEDETLRLRGEPHQLPPKATDWPAFLAAEAERRLRHEPPVQHAGDPRATPATVGLMGPLQRAIYSMSANDAAWLRDRINDEVAAKLGGADADAPDEWEA